MYATVIKKIENIFVFLVKYIVPVAMITVLVLLFFRVINGFEIQEFFAYR